jgi:carboxypeptidase C (cathepsin A)
MGALGPRRVVMQQPDGWMPASPYRMTDNEYTIIEKTDLVMMDAIGTGFSRARNEKALKRYLGVKGDIEATGEFMRMYITRNDRWPSPLYILGESYGTTRAAGVAGYLVRRGISFGIILLSAAVDLGTLEDTRGNDLPYVLLIPTYSMIAAYHHKLAPDLAADPARLRSEATQWAATTYAQALAKGDSISPEERASVIEQMARYTGLDKKLLDNANLRIDVAKFTHNLLLDQKLRVGRLDGRFTGPDPQGLLDTPFYDPSSAQPLPPFTSTFNNYVRTERRPGFLREVGLGQRHRGISQHRRRIARGHDHRSLSQDPAHGGLLRPGDAVLCRRLHHRPSELAGEPAQEHQHCSLRLGPHGVPAA